MKKIYVLVSLMTMLIASAQERDKGSIELVPQIGYSNATYVVTKGGISGYSSLAAITYGLGADFYFNNRWSIRSGLFMQKNGAEYSGGKDELNYLTVPVNVNWHFGSTRKWYLNFGLSAGFVTSANETVLGTKNDIKEYVNSSQVGMNIGIGYKIFINDKFSLAIDYQSVSGLGSANKLNTEYYKLANSFGSFNLGGVFILGK